MVVLLVAMHSRSMIGNGLCLSSGGCGGIFHVLDVSGLGIYVQDVPVIGLDGLFGNDVF